MPEVPCKEPYETEKTCPICAMSPPPNLRCMWESKFAGSSTTRHLECPRCGYTTQDVVNKFGTVVLEK